MWQRIPLRNTQREETHRTRCGVRGQKPPCQCMTLLALQCVCQPGSSSKPIVYGFLWTFHYIGILDYITGYWWLNIILSPFLLSRDHEWGWIFQPSNHMVFLGSTSHPKAIRFPSTKSYFINMPKTLIIQEIPRVWRALRQEPRTKIKYFFIYYNYSSVIECCLLFFFFFFIRTLSIVVLNSWFNNTNIPAIFEFGSDVCTVSSRTVLFLFGLVRFYLSVCLVFFV